MIESSNIPSSVSRDGMERYALHSAISGMPADVASVDSKDESLLEDGESGVPMR